MKAVRNILLCLALLVAGCSTKGGISVSGALYYPWENDGQVSRSRSEYQRGTSTHYSSRTARNMGAFR